MEIIISRSKMTVLINDTQKDFPKKEFDLLYYLANNQGMALTRKQMIDVVWRETNGYIVDRTVDVHIKKLREKIGDEKDENGEFVLINTIKCIGYRLSKDVNIKVDDNVTKNVNVVKTEDDLIVNGTYKDTKRNVVIINNIAESKFGRLVIFIGAGFCNAMSIKDFKSVYRPS